jgi:hypothetical protein
MQGVRWADVAIDLWFNMASRGMYVLLLNDDSGGVRCGPTMQDEVAEAGSSRRWVRRTEDRQGI